LTHYTLLHACTHRLDQVKAYATHFATFPDNLRMLHRFADWADLPLIEITPDMVQAKIISPAQELDSNNNANKHLIALKAVFSLAVKSGKLTRNPCVGIQMLPVERKAKIIPERDQVARVLLLANPLDRAYLALIRFTAARINEINRLTWEDVEGGLCACGQTRRRVGIGSPGGFPALTRWSMRCGTPISTG
jgi:integrase